MSDEEKDEKRSEIASKLGKLGGEATLKKYGTSHYKKMIERRWEKYRKEKKNKDT